MPQTPVPSTSNDQLFKALKAAGYPVTLDWVQKLYDQGLTSAQIVNQANKKWPNVNGEGGQAPSLEDILNSVVSGSGGSGSGGGGVSGPDPAALRANYLEILRRWGLAPGQGGLSNLVDHAVNGEWTTTQFIQAVRKTAPYKTQFAGIQWRNGMTEGEYIRRFGAYRELAQNGGRGLTREQFGVLLNKGVTTSEFKLRIDALQRMKDFRPLFNTFEDVLKARGLIKPNEQLSQKELYKFIIKQGDPRWEQVWQESVVTQGFQSAGITIGKHGDFTRKELLKLIHQVDTPRSEVESLTLQDFQKLATSIQDVMPLSQLYGSGVTKKDLAVLAVGGVGADKIASRVQEIMATRNLSQEQKAQPQFYQTEKGSKLNYGGLAGEAGE